MKYLITYNESIRHLLKSNPKKDIRKYNIVDEELINNICRYDIIDLVPDVFKNLKNSQIEHYLLMSIDNDSTNIINYILNNYIIKKSMLNYGLTIDCNIGNMNVIKKLIKLGADPSSYNNECIKTSHINNNLELVNYLLKDERVLNSLNSENKEKYISTNESIKHLLKPKSEEDIKKTVKNLSPQEKLYHACKNNILWLAKEAIEEGANINGYDTEDYTPLIDSFHNNSFEVFKFLLEKGADIKETRDLWEQNILELSVYYGKYEYVQELLKYKIDLSRDDILSLLDNIDVQNIYGDNAIKIEKLLKNYFKTNNLSYL